MPKPHEQLVIQHLENVSRRLLDKHQDVVREYVKGRHGVYALYRNDKLYYVGLASNLRNRLRTHLKDKHAAGWNRFSLYLTEDVAYLRELEALVLRITVPSGNKARMKLPRSRDLSRYFKRSMIDSFRRELEQLFKGSRKARPGSGRGPSDSGPVIKSRKSLRRTYKGKLYRATLRPDGRVRFRGKIYPSPTAAAKMITKRPVFGWTFWRYERAPGEWIRLNELRRAGKRRKRKRAGRRKRR